MRYRPPAPCASVVIFVRFCLAAFVPLRIDQVDMTKSELIELLARKQVHLKAEDVDLAVKAVLEQMSSALANGDRIEIRGFGSFSLHFRPARLGRNPKTGDSVTLSGKYVPHFKPGKELRERVNSVEVQDAS